ncbi:MAG: protease inhibitor I42 family protein [Lentisphaeria bacterium]|nr:protease inhibitor I42 family protein [Lentisphaeria bacterium]
MKNHLFIVLVCFLAVGVSQAGTCARCKGMMLVTNMGKCKKCGERTTSGAKQYCPKCSDDLNRCEVCGVELENGKKKTGALKLHLADSGKSIVLGKGQKVEIILPGNPSTGYSWIQKERTGDSVEMDGKMSYASKPSPQGMAGVGGVYTLTLCAVKNGESTLEYVYRRAWENKKKPMRTFTIKLLVQDR